MLPKPNKSLGQNFLQNTQFSNYIAGLCTAQNGQLIEIGCGTGQLTRSILGLISPKRNLHGIEIDARMEPILADIAKEYSNFSYQIGDFLELGLPTMQDIALCGNLPYNIGTKIVLYCIQNGIKEWTFLLQKEVVQRIAAKVGSPEYGSLSVLAQACYNISLGKVVPPNAFYPMPKVDSQVISAKKIYDLTRKSFLKLSTILKVAFSCRRKMIKNTLCKSFNIEGIDPTIRPQDLSPAQYLSLIKSLTEEQVQGESATKK